jgi:WD40 repeat protein
VTSLRLWLVTSGLLVLASCHPRPGSVLWSYRRDGNGSNEPAAAVTTDRNGNVYAAGCLDAEVWNRVFTVVALTNSGVQRWLVTLDSMDYSGGNWSSASALTCDDAGNVYVAGSHRGEMVVSLSPAGAIRWKYPSTPGSTIRAGLGIVRGADGNIYAAGRSSDTLYKDHFTVVSLTPEGEERWVYRPRRGVAYSLDWGPDGNLYVAGDMDSIGFVVVSLRPDGTVRWTGDRDHDGGAATSLAFFDDGSVAVTGYSLGELCVGRYSADGERLWTWQRPYGRTWTYVMSAVATDGLGNVYLAGYTADSFTVAGLDRDGQQKWLHVAPSSSSGVGAGQAIVVSPTGEVYCAGSTDGVATTVYGFANDGSLLWSHSLGTLWGKSYVGGIAIAPDGNVLVAGSSAGYLSDGDFVVTCLTPGAGD